MYLNVKTVLSKMKLTNKLTENGKFDSSSGKMAVFSAVSRMRYEIIGDVTNQRIIS